MKKYGYTFAAVFSALGLAVFLQAGGALAAADAQEIKAAYDRYLKSYNEFKEAVGRNCDEDSLRVYTKNYINELENYRRLKGDEPAALAVPTEEVSNAQQPSPAAVKMAPAEVSQPLESVSRELGAAKTQDQISAAIVKLNVIIATSEDRYEVLNAKRALGEAYMLKKEYAQAIETFQELLKEKDSVDREGIQKSIAYAESLQKNIVTAPVVIASGSAGAAKTWFSSVFSSAKSKISSLASSAGSMLSTAKSKALSFLGFGGSGSDGLKRIESEDAVTTADNGDDNGVIEEKKRPFITGAFFQLSEGHTNGDEYPLQYWLTELGAMQAIGMDTLIIQDNQYNGVNYSEASERILTAADQLGMKVFVGTALNESTLWYTVNKFNPVWLANEGKTIANYTRILVRQFKPHASFVGVYIPYEDNTVGLPGPVGEFYGAIVKAVKDEDPQLLTLISPFTCIQPGRAKSLPKPVLEKYFKAMLAKAKVDICAWQDGVGGTRDQLKKVDNDLGAIVNACKELGITVWSNAEIFHRTTPLSQAFDAEATDFETAKTQIESEYKYVSKMICFDFNHYFSPNIGSPTAKTLYEKYKAYYDENKMNYE